VGRGSHGLYFGPGAWRPVPGTDLDLGRAAGRVAAAMPAVFPDWVIATAPERISDPVAFDPPEAALVFMLDGPAANPDGPAAATGPTFWLAWPGRYGAHPRATRGPKYRAASTCPWAEDD